MRFAGVFGYMHMFGICVSTVSTVRRPVNIDDFYVRIENRIRKYSKYGLKWAKVPVLPHFLRGYLYYVRNEGQFVEMKFLVKAQTSCKTEENVETGLLFRCLFGRIRINPPW